MALLYRTIFSVSTDNLVDAVQDAFANWLRSKDVTFEVPDSGSTGDDRLEIHVARRTSDNLEAGRYVLHEKGEREGWSTSITAISNSAENVIWIDLDRDTTDPYGKQPVVAVPRVVRELLHLEDARIGPTPLALTPFVIDEAGVPALVDQLTDPDRTAPVVVISRDRYASPDLALERGEQMLRRVLGLAPVIILEGAATSALSEAVGPDLHVFGGAVRTYFPNLTIPDRAPRRHPFVAGRIFASQTSAAASRVQRSILQQAVALRPPAIYRDQVMALPGFPGHRGGSDEEELLQQMIELDDQRDELALALRDATDEVEFSALQLDETEALLDQVQARVRYLEGRLRAAGDHASANDATPSSAVPDTAESCQEVLGLARQYLSNLEVGDTDFQAQSLDTYPKSSVWARKAWRAFRALNDFAEAKRQGKFSGDFLSFCGDGRSTETVIPSGWVAMRESESTDNNPNYRGARTFPVPPEVNADEEQYMCAHVKIEPGGRPAPRIHFYDDSGGETGQIHIGYFGEHLPNDQTN